MCPACLATMLVAGATSGGGLWELSRGPLAKLQRVQKAHRLDVSVGLVGGERFYHRLQCRFHCGGASARGRYRIQLSPRGCIRGFQLR
jgi:hypothetical protein